MREFLLAALLGLASTPAFAIDPPTVWQPLGGFYDRGTPSAAGGAATGMAKALSQSAQNGATAPTIVTPSGTAVSRSCSLQVGGANTSGLRIGQPVISTTTVTTVIQVCN